MKTKGLFLIFFFSFAVSLAFGGQNKEKSEWFPFAIAEKLDAGSPANIGKIVLDAPAGKHGFIQARSGHFYFQDGTRAKFWGTNLVFSACFPSKEQAKILADRLAFFGFNVVRLHHMDFYFEPEGIFKDTCPECADPQMKKTGILSERQLDRLDYLIYQLKIRGIYVDMNLLVSRHFTKADGVAGADRLEMAAKPASFFDPRLIELQKQYAKDLLTHFNPYTRLRYCDDPTVALVEITNENSIFMSERKNLPSYYSNQLMNGNGVEEFYLDLEKSFFKDMTNFLKNGCSVKVPITGIGGYWRPEDIQAQEVCDFLDSHTYWDHPQFPHRPWDDNDFLIHDRSMLLDKDLGIIGTLKNRQPSLKNKPYTVSEWNHCYPNRFAYEAPLLLAAEAHLSDWDGLFQFAFKHGLSASQTYDNIDYYFDTMNNPQQLILSSLASVVFLRTVEMEREINSGILLIRSTEIDGAIGFVKNKPLRLGHFLITADHDGAVVIYKKPGSFLLVGMSEVKNTDSGWGKGMFQWGHGPVLLKKIGLRCQADFKKALKVYELDERGNRKNEVKTNQKQGRIIFSTAESDSPWFEIETE